MNLSDFKVLEILILKNFHFQNAFILKLDNLKTLEILFCSNISIDKNTCLGIKKLYLIYSNIHKIFFLDFPELEDFNLNYVHGIINVINFNNLNKLKRFIGTTSDFLNLGKTSLEYVKLTQTPDNTLDKERELLRKIISIKTLKNIELWLNVIDTDTINLINYVNKTVEIACIYWTFPENDCILYSLQKKFPNLSDLSLYFLNNKKCQTKLEITENEECKINKISLIVFKNENIKFYCNSFENLIKIDFTFNNEIINIKDCFPIFSDECKVKFKSLTKFKLYINYEIELNIIKNIYKNIDSIPNLIYFSLNCNVKEINKDFYIKFINKILSKKLSLIYLKLTTNEELYLLNELKKICNNIKTLNLDKINIYKIK